MQYYCQKCKKFITPWLVKVGSTKILTCPTCGNSNPMKLVEFAETYDALLEACKVALDSIRQLEAAIARAESAS